jgi:hypothetical protein
MMDATQTVDVNGTEATYKNAVTNAYNAAALKADDARDVAAYEPVDTAAQAALENSPLTGGRFTTAHGEVWETVYTLAQRCETTDELADKLEQVRVELLRVTYEN